jgi:hypothetical protein
VWPAAGALRGDAAAVAGRVRRRDGHPQRDDPAALSSGPIVAAGGAFTVPSLAAWVSVLSTTPPSSLPTSSPQHYQYLIIEYLSTAAELKRLRDHQTDALCAW